MQQHQTSYSKWLGVLALALALVSTACGPEEESPSAGAGGAAGVISGGAGGMGGAGGASGVGGGTGGAGGGGPVQPAGAPTFAAIFTEILTKGSAGNCTFGACHGQPPMVNSGNLELISTDKDMTYAHLVGPMSASTVCAGMAMVVPGQPEMSLLYKKLLPMPPCGARMPFGSMLTDGQIEQIRLWIANGAMNDGMVTGGAGGMGGAGGAAGMTGGMGGGGAGGEAGGGAGGMGGGTFTLTSETFTDDGMLPQANRCVALAGETGPSPQFSWMNAPAGTMSFAMTLTDPNTAGSNGGYMHWTLWDIPGTATSLAAGVMRTAMPNPPMGAKQCDNENAFVPGPGYFGPCGAMNPYEFKLTALDVATLPGVTTASGPAEVRAAITEHEIESVTMTAVTGPPNAM